VGWDRSIGNSQATQGVVCRFADFVDKNDRLERCPVDDTIRVDHNVGFIKGCNARFEIERDEGWINMKTAKGTIFDRYRCEFVEVVIDTSA